MKAFNIELLKPKGGWLNALLFKNSYLNIPETLFYSIQIDLDEFTLDNNQIEPSIDLGFIRFDVNQLKELESKTFTFPINPVEGHIDGSIHLFGFDLPFDVNKIELKTINNDTIEITLYHSISLDYVDTGYADIIDSTLITNLQFGELTIHRDILSPDNFDPDNAKKIVSKFISIRDLGEPEIVSGQIKFKMQPH